MYQEPVVCVCACRCVCATVCCIQILWIFNACLAMLPNILQCCAICKHTHTHMRARTQRHALRSVCTVLWHFKWKTPSTQLWSTCLSLHILLCILCQLYFDYPYMHMHIHMAYALCIVYICVGLCVYGIELSSQPFNNFVCLIGISIKILYHMHTHAHNYTHI